MSQVVLDITMSLAGFVTAPNDGPGRGLGDDGECLHYWVFGGPWTYGESQQERPGATGVDREVLDELMAAGAAVVGRRMYDVTDGWGGTSPFGGIGGGASIAQQALQAELVDELQIHIAPVILGAGRPLFGELGTRLRRERTRVLDSPFATHIKFRVLK